MNSESDVTVSDSQRLLARRHSAQNRRWAKAVGLLLLAVAAGFVMGVGSTVLYFKKKMHRVPPRPEAIVEAMVEHMDSLVSLKPDEKTRLTELMASHMGEVDALRGRYFRDMRQIFKGMDAEIEKVIGPERFKIWYADKEKRSEERRRDRERRRRPGDGPPGDRPPGPGR